MLASPALSRVQVLVGSTALRSCRGFSIANATQEDVRSRLAAELKTSMKNRDAFTATTLRSVLAEIQNADKSYKQEKVESSTVISIIRKATQRRNDAAQQFSNASRPDLAEKEKRESDLLSSFLPPLLPESEIDRLLHDAMVEQVSPGEDPRKASGKIFKAFYSKVDKSLVDADLVKRRAAALLIGHK